MTRLRTFWFAALIVLVAILSAGCERSDDQIRTYVAPKDAPEVRPVGWSLPAGWHEVQAGEMQYTAFAVDPEHSDATLTVVALPREANDLAPNVNRWEGQLGLPPSTPEAVEKLVTHVDLDGAHADLVDLTGTNVKTQQPSRVLAAIVPHGTQTWFFTLKGPPDVVAVQKANFDAFVRSLKFKPDLHAPTDEPHPSLAMANGPAGSGAESETRAPTGPMAERIKFGALPPGWTEDATPRSFRTQTLLVDVGGKKAEVIVSRLPSQGAGQLIDNVNRWRGHVGLAPIQDPSEHKPRETTVVGTRGFAFDFEGPAKDGTPAKRQIVAMTSDASNMFWFFRFIGPKDLIDAQQAAFEKLLAGAQFVTRDGQLVPPPPQQQEQLPSTTPSTQPSGSPR